MEQRLGGLAVPLWAKQIRATLDKALLDFSRNCVSSGLLKNFSMLASRIALYNSATSVNYYPKLVVRINIGCVLIVR